MTTHIYSNKTIAQLAHRIWNRLLLPHFRVVCIAALGSDTARKGHVFEKSMTMRYVCNWEDGGWGSGQAEKRTDMCMSRDPTKTKDFEPSSLKLAWVIFHNLIWKSKKSTTTNLWSPNYIGKERERRMGVGEKHKQTKSEKPCIYNKQNYSLKKRKAKDSENTGNRAESCKNRGKTRDWERRQDKALHLLRHSRPLRSLRPCRHPFVYGLSEALPD